MGWDRYKRLLWEKLSEVHADARVAGSLRAISLVGIVVGFAGFMIGLNPVVAILVADRFDPGGDLLARIGVTGLLVHVASAGYYYATAPPRPEDGLFRY